jgi:CRISPR-associated protein Csb2
VTVAAGVALGQVQVVRYALAAGPLPPVIRTLEVGELARRAVLSRYGGADKRPAPPLLSGHDGTEPVRSHHRHAFYLPVDEDEDGLIDHLLLYAPEGFAPDVLEVLEGLEALFAGEWLPGWPLRLEEMLPASALRTGGSPWMASAVWESVTPFVLSRYPKQYRDGTPKLTWRGEQRDGPEDQARREWSLRQAVEDLPELVEVERVPALVIRGRPVPWRAFALTRRWGVGRSSGFAYGLRLRFAAPVAGPVLLGYGCHFGLGQFRPVRG